jgi:hypothetical protein
MALIARRQRVGRLGHGQIAALKPAGELSRFEFESSCVQKV